MSVSQDYPDEEARLEQLTKTVTSGDQAALSRVISTQSHGNRKEDVLAEALAICCANGCHSAALHLLSKEKADPNIRFESPARFKGKTPLVLAACSCETDSSVEPCCFSRTSKPNSVADTIAMVKTLFEHKALLDVADSDGKTALSHMNHIDVAKALLEGRDQSDLRLSLDRKDNDGDNGLYFTFTLRRRGTTSVAMLLISYRADTKAVDSEGRTTLMVAIWRGHIAVVRMLLQDREVVRTLDNRGRNVWHHIASDPDSFWGSAEMLDLLMSIENEDADSNAAEFVAESFRHHSDLGSEQGMRMARKTPLHVAAQFGKVELASWLITNGVAVDSTCEGNNTPLHLACGYNAGTVNIVRLLLENGSNIHAQTDSHSTPLHIASYHGHADVVQLLLAKGAGLDLKSTCNGGWSPLHLACTAGPVSAYETLWQAKPLQHVKVVDILLSHVADVNQKSLALRTPLHLAAAAGHSELVERLLQQNDVFMTGKDSRGNTPLFDAARSSACRDWLLGARKALVPCQRTFGRQPENLMLTLSISQGKVDHPRGTVCQSICCCIVNMEKQGW